MDRVGSGNHNPSRAVSIAPPRPSPETRSLIAGLACSYILSVVLARLIPLEAIAAFVHSHPTSLRLTNLLLSLPLPYIYANILDLLGSPRNGRATSKGKQTPSALAAQRDRHSLNRAEGLVLALFPITAFFSGLYYTDVGGLLFVMECWRRGLQGRYGRSALVSLDWCERRTVHFGVVAGSKTRS